ncbi:unnamed protein product, partial [Didymodactylos carnosus]
TKLKILTCDEEIQLVCGMFIQKCLRYGRLTGAADIHSILANEDYDISLDRVKEILKVLKPAINIKENKDFVENIERGRVAVYNADTKTISPLGLDTDDEDEYNLNEQQKEVEENAQDSDNGSDEDDPQNPATVNHTKPPQPHSPVSGSKSSMQPNEQHCPPQHVTALVHVNPSDSSVFTSLDNDDDFSGTANGFFNNFD